MMFDEKNRVDDEDLDAANNEKNNQSEEIKK